MLKKVILIFLLLCLVFSISVMAENENTIANDSVPEVSEQIPQNAQELPQGEQGNKGMPPSGNMQGRKPSDMPNGEMPPEMMNRGQRPQGNFTPPQNTDVNNTQAATSQPNGNESKENFNAPNGNQLFGNQIPAGMGGFPSNMQNFNSQVQEETPKGFLGFVKTYSTPITSVILLGLAFVFVVFYRRKNY